MEEQIEHNKETGLDQDQSDERSVDSETLLEAAKGEPDAVEAVAQEDPTSQVVDPEAAASVTPRKASTSASALDPSVPSTLIILLSLLIPMALAPVEPLPPAQPRLPLLVEVRCVEKVQE